MVLVQNILSFNMFFLDSLVVVCGICDDSQSFMLICRKAWLHEDQGVKRYFQKIRYYDTWLTFLKLNSLIAPNSLILLLHVRDLLHLNIGRNPASTQSWKMYYCYPYYHQPFIASSVCNQ